MAFSSGARTAASEAASWAVAGICLVVGFIYFDELKSVFGPGAPGDASRVAAAVEQRPDRRQSGANNQDQPDSPGGGYRVELTAGGHGHYKTEASVNGRAVNVLVDTGATYVALTAEDAERAGVFVSPADFKHGAQTANGVARIAIVSIDRVSIGDIEVRDVRASVHERGALNMSLLGMSFLGKLRRAEMRSGRLVLEN